VKLSSSTLQVPVPRYPCGRRAAVVERVARAVVGRGSGRLAVVVDGRTGAGKTTFAHELGLALERMGRPVCRAGLDDFKRPWSERDRYDRASGAGYFRNAYDHGRIARDLVGLWDVRIALHVDRDVALRRGLSRDSARGDAVPHDDDVEVLHRSRYAAADDLYLRETDVLAAADVVVDNTDPDAPVIRAFGSRRTSTSP
jgi:uridine kinase